MSAAAKGLQLLVDSFAIAEDADARDELLQEIISHPAEQAIGFLRLVADNAEEDQYLRCDAVCAIAMRTGGAEQLERVLLFLANPYDAYEYCSACGVIAETGLAEAVAILMAHFDAPLEEACLDATVGAVEAVGDVEALHGWLAAQGKDADEARVLLVCGALQRLRAPQSQPVLEAFAARVSGPLAAAAHDAAEAIGLPPEEE